MPRCSALPLLALPILIGAAPPTVQPGIWTNEEDRYFAGEAKAAAIPDWLGIEVGGDGRWRSVDSYARPLGEWRTDPVPAATSGAKVTATAANGVTTELRRGRSYKCWVFVKRYAAKPDGSEDWSTHFNLRLHDQGGRVLVEPQGGPAVVIRLRNVIWPPPSTNNPSLVLYIHKPDQPDRAVSYGWADPDAKRLGINLRWVQANCIREGETR